MCTKQTADTRVKLVELDRFLTLADNWLEGKTARERLMLYLLLLFALWAFIFSPMELFFAKKIKQLMAQNPNSSTANELIILQQIATTKEMEIKSLRSVSEKISVDLAMIKATIENTPELYLDSAALASFTDLSLKTIQKYGGTLVSISPSKIKLEPAGSLLSCTIDLKFRASLKNSMHILNELENSKHSPHIRSFSITDKSDEVSTRLVLYGVSR